MCSYIRGTATYISQSRAASVAEMKLIFSVVAVLALCGTLTHSAAVNDNDVSGTMKTLMDCIGFACIVRT